MINNDNMTQYAIETTVTIGDMVQEYRVEAPTEIEAHHMMRRLIDRQPCDCVGENEGCSECSVTPWKNHRANAWGNHR